ncbi:DNA-directed RNA polymerase ECF sigma factor [Alkalihalobacillus alcalophilus ATCC 27647 = CGMCC 1.3604]|uniref:DNA-directed RNA polymerase ECF sigma factor n=1 Tax=Alkalihalobacillus alcalophilus ATCC 27647 = CGMCC 1.3604 TaxID=1218173 RepID=A0A094XAY9_ALKAL|nr:sigma-70 family RNA polymerase sigma factor [Alkalihalobacillus alcalophilus]KGA95955.1 DNA-directed RNA polymerase subunit sigma [Alkalihalobacillus alcalophilus ATCC 27647 = CGMCC 1.3604]MED1561772.1 sigma-70 family RNA polymerase sigma factor [Alkalihalobacillus alcalophilus]THG89096.1 DNA-directed RNA polymerase ECF sigma factor [Alkalihalobacillus alcalophilus ATCC 27647 = CGMCC 1.3604]
MKHDIHTVKRAINGDVKAFEEVLFLEEKMLYYKALSYVGKKEDALDAIQETSCKAFLSIGQLQNPEYFSTWLFRILIRECYKLLKKRDRIIPYEENKLLMRLEQGRDEEIESFHLSEALSKLNSSYQTSIILFYYHDLPIQVISEIMEKPVGTIKTYLRRAKKSLKDDLERSYKLHG